MRPAGPSTSASGPRGRRPGSVVALLTLLLGGCGADPADDPTGATTPGAATRSAVTSGADPADEPAAGAPADPTGAPPGPGGGSDDFDHLDEGRHTGLLTDLGDGVLDGQQVAVLGFDKVDFLTGQEAVDAAREAGVIGPDEIGVPNDYFVRNDNPLVRHLPVRPGTEVLVLDGGSPRLLAGDLEQAVAAGSLFELDVVDEDGVSLVTRVSAVYVP